MKVKNGLLAGEPFSQKEEANFYSWSSTEETERNSFAILKTEVHGEQFLFMQIEVGLATRKLGEETEEFSQQQTWSLSDPAKRKRWQK